MQCKVKSWNIIEKNIRQIRTEIEETLNEILEGGGEIKHLTLAPLERHLLLILIYKGEEK